jgi:outer membrane usher protein
LIPRFALICGFVLACAAIALAEPTTEDQAASVHPDRVTVRINASTIATNAVVYLADDGTIYVSSEQLSAWGLKPPFKPAFELDKSSYFGLQTDLHLAIGYDRTANEVEIVAPPSAFVGEQASALPPLTRPSGSYLNYTLRREDGEYTFASALVGGTFQTTYLSTAGADGLEFHRGTSRLFWLNSNSHTVLQIGDGSTDSGDLGTTANIGGIHFGTDSAGDPGHEPSVPPSVTGYATSPSLLEVYIDNILELREYVPAGPFTLRDLPANASNSNVVMVLTNAQGVKTTQVAQPNANLGVVARGRTTFSVDAGLAQENINQKGSYYRGGVVDGNARYGLTSAITLEAYAESIKGENFGNIGTEIELSPKQELAARIGTGNRRRASEYEYTFEQGPFSLRETIRLNSITAQQLPDVDAVNVTTQISESSELGLRLSSMWQAQINLERTRDSNGFNSSTLTGRFNYRNGPITVSMGPIYDFIARRPSGNATVEYQLTENQRLRAPTSVTQNGDVGQGLEYRKDPASPADPLSYDARIAFERSQTSQLSITAEEPFAELKLDGERLYGQNIFEPEMRGGLAFVGGHTYAVRDVSTRESFGLLHLPGLSRVRVLLNHVEVGRTDKRGDLLLRNLSPYRLNTVTVEESDLPRDVRISPVIFVPQSGGSVVKIPVRRNRTSFEGLLIVAPATM